MSTLALDRIHKKYGDLPALSGVSVRFPENLITAIIGPSGCGKSTLLKLFNGLIKPDSGQVKVFGQPLDYNDLPSIRRRLGYAVQGNGLFPHLSGRDNITLLARLEAWPPQQVSSRIEELLQLTQLEEVQLDQYPHQLSGGQQQRIGLCRAMMLHPEVLLLDEPFAAIDPITRTDIHQQLLKLHRAEPSTTLLVTHDIREALKLADHIVIMGAGQVLYSESKAALLQRDDSAEPEVLLQNLLAGAPA